MRIKTTVRRDEVEKIPGAIGRVWGVDGEARFPVHLETAKVIVKTTKRCSYGVRARAQLHELGHVARAQDMVDAIGTDSAFAVLKDETIWESEVEAWVHAIESEPETFTGSNGFVPFHFALDCLNSYRRGYGVSDEKWDQVVGLLDDYANAHGELHKYQPLEPDPNEAPPSPCTPGLGQPEPGEKDDEVKGEGYASGSPDNGGDYDDRWFEQRVVDAVLEGQSINEIAAETGYDFHRVPPLITAMINEARDMS